MSTKHNIVIPKTANYYTIGDIKTAKTIWIVLHGYGYLAEFFIKKFEPILNNGTCVIAPEALSRFYLNGFSGRIGATWMTKHQREEEILDYTNYLQLLYENVLKENHTDEPKINVLGFSQGGATACRWLASKNVPCTNFILWANFFPEDINFDVIPNGVNLFLIYGTHDEFLTDERIEGMKKQLAHLKVECKIIIFDGPHDIPKDILIEQTELNNWG